MTEYTYIWAYIQKHPQETKQGKRKKKGNKKC